MLMDTRIGVTVLTGFLGSGKTTLLNRLLQSPRYAGAAVVVNELGSISVDHHLTRHVAEGVSVIEGGCICCTVRGALVESLRELFFLALQRRIKPFDSLILETSGLATPAPVLFTLRHEAFLRERYVHRGTITVADPRRIEIQLRDAPEAAQQLALADQIALTKSDLASPEQLLAARRIIEAVNPGVPMYDTHPSSPLPAPLRSDRLDLGGATRAPAWPRPGGEGFSVRHAKNVVTCAVAIGTMPSRAAFLGAMAGVQMALGDKLMRAKGVVGIDGEPAPQVVQAVHDEHYPLTPLPGAAAPDFDGQLVFIARGMRVEELASVVAAHFGGWRR